MQKLKQLVKEFKDEFVKENHSYQKMDLIRLELDELAKTMKQQGVWNQKQVNKVTGIGFFYHRNDVEYDFFNRRKLLCLLDDVLVNGV